MIERAFHGGDVAGIARRYGRRVDELLDFSANINPLGPPPEVRTLVERYASTGALTRYPEPGLPELAAVLADARGVAPDNIVIHAGSAALFDVLLRACRPRRLGIGIPAFAEYARAAQANEIPVATFALEPGSAALDRADLAQWVRRRDVDALIVTNPHNPLGFRTAAGILRALRAQLPAVLTIVDEAFADYDETVSIARDAARDERLAVVRSLTKFYALPDLRVGYAVMTAANARRCARYIPAWPVSGIAAAAAAAAVRDTAYAARTRASNAAERERLCQGLTGLGLRVLPAAANFVTFERRGASALAERLITRHGIIVRDCTSFAGLPPDAYVRVAVRDAPDNARLLAALASD